LLFILCIEPLLCRLAESFPEASVKAFADDIGMVLPDVQRRWKEIIVIFDSFGMISGLHIHPTKTILIPLGNRTPDEIRNSTWFSSSAWNRAPIQMSAKYLGVYIGPGATSQLCFQGPVDKMRLRVRWWSGLGLSLHQKFQVWNVYVAPVLSYVEQCRRLSPEDNKTILRMLMAFVGGVGNWMVPEALGFFGLWFGVPVAPRLPLITNIASLVRVSIHIHLLDPDVRMRNARIGPDLSFCCGADAMTEAERVCSSCNIDAWQVLQDLLRQHGGQQGANPDARKLLQKTLCAKLLSHFSGHPSPSGYALARCIRPETVWRARWQRNLICIAPHTLNRCILRSLRAIRGLCEARLVPPRVIFAALRLFYHAWPTKSRCRILVHKCFLCGIEQGDCLNHIVRCPKARSTYARYGVCQAAEYSPEAFMLCDRVHSHGENITMSAVIAAAFYKLLNKLRHGCNLSPNFDNQFDRFLNDTISNHSADLYRLVITRRRCAQPRVIP
jgi:hypothetical protein